MDVPWDIFWHAQAYRGLVGILDDKRDALSMPMQRDAMRTGVRPDLNTESAAAIIASRERARAARRDLQPEGRRSPTTRRCPRRRRCCTSRGRATCSAPPSTTCRRASSPTSSRSGRRSRTASSRTTSSASAARRRARCSRTRFLNFVLDEKNAYSNFVDFTGYTPPQNAIDAEALIKQGLIPKSLAHAVVRPDQFAANQELLAAERRGRARSGTTPGRSSRPAECSPGGSGASLACPGVAWLSIFFLVAFYAVRLGRVRQPGHALAAGAVLEPAATGTSATCSASLRDIWHGGPFFIVFAAHDQVRRDRDGALARDRLPGRLLRRPARRALEGHRAAPADRAVLDQLPDADARVDQPALAGRLGHEGRCTTSGSSGLFLSARPARANREAGSTGSRRP